MLRLCVTVGCLALTAACGPGVPGEVIAETEDYALGLTQDDVFLYWHGQSDVFALPKEGGEVRTLAEGQDVVTMAATAGRLCWVGRAEGVYRISCVPREGGELQVLDEEPLDPSILRDLVADGEALFWSNSNGEIKRLPLTGGDSTVFALVDTALSSLAVAADFVYASVPGGIIRINKADPAVTETVAVGAVVVPQGLALGVGDDPNIYWVEMNPVGTDGLVLGTPRGGRSQAVILADNQILPSDIAPGPQFVYWGTGYVDSHIRRVPVNFSRAVEDFASGTRVVGAPQVDEAAVYWLDYDGKVHRAPR